MIIVLYHLFDYISEWVSLMSVKLVVWFVSLIKE